MARGRATKRFYKIARLEIISLLRFARRANFLAEGVGFEPTSPFGETVFKTAAIDHSAIPPGIRPAGANQNRLIACSL